jgi:xanthomonalisin
MGDNDMNMKKISAIKISAIKISAIKISAITSLQHLATALCAASLVFIAAAAQAEQRPIMTTHVPHAVATGVAPLVGHVPGTQHLSLAISLPLRNQTELTDLLQRLYDPQSPSFHKYLSVQEFTGRFGPTGSEYEAVLHFAQTYGLAVVSMYDNNMVVDVEAPAANIENAFHITLGVYQHPTESRTFYAPDREPTVDLDVPLLHISGLDNYSLPHAKNVRSSQRLSTQQLTSNGTGSGPGGQFIGSDMREAYYGS